MRKKGQGYSNELLIFHIAIPLMAIILGIALWWYIASNADMTIYWKNFYTKDIALTMDTVYGVPGNVNVYYKLRSNQHDFNFNIGNGFVETRQNPNDNPSRFQFGRSSFMTINESNALDNSFFIKKQDNAITFNQLFVPKCNYGTTTDAAYKTKKYYFKSLDDDAQTKANALTQLARLNQLPMADNEKNADVLIYFRTDQYALNYAFGSNKNKKFSCLMEQQLITMNPQLEIITTYIFPERTYPLLTKEPSILISVPKDQDPEQLSIIVMKTIEEYFA
jgi:hypothetical protein